MGKTKKKIQYHSNLDHSKKNKATKKEKESNFEELEPWDETAGDQNDDSVDLYIEEDDAANG